MEEQIERTLKFINSLSPWNLNRGSDAIRDLIASEKSKLLDELLEKAGTFRPLPQAGLIAKDIKAIPIAAIEALKEELNG